MEVILNRLITLATFVKWNCVGWNLWIVTLKITYHPPHLHHPSETLEVEINETWLVVEALEEYAWVVALRILLLHSWLKRKLVRWNIENYHHLPQLRLNLQKNQILYFHHRLIIDITIIGNIIPRLLHHLPQPDTLRILLQKRFPQYQQFLHWNLP